MRVTFDHWGAVSNTYESWWRGELARPLVNLFVRDPRETVEQRLGSPPDLTYTRFTGKYPPETPVEAIIDSYDYELAARRYVADGFPSTSPNFGAGCLAAMTGCTMVAREDTIWFEAPEQVNAEELSIPVTPDSDVARRIEAFYKEAVKVWGPAVQLGMTDLGGTLDILQSFFPSAGLSLELFDHPEEIKRLIDEVHVSWWNHFTAFSGMVAHTNRGFTAWTPLLSQESYYMLQCDFAFMIGPDMFDEFVLPELSRSCANLKRPFYHLDGTGQLAHLDKILAIPGLAGVQWIPGDGAPDTTQWPEVYRKIRDAGKLIQVFTFQSDIGLGILDVLAKQIGDLSGVAVIGDIPAEDEEQARRTLERHGVPWMHTDG